MLGGNVFGWTVNEHDGFALLDQFVAAGGNFIDTADVYSAWVPGHVGGESETIIGNWLASRRVRRQMVIATKVGMAPGLKGLSPTTIRSAAEASLRRLRMECLDLHYAHVDDPDTPLEDSLRAFTSLVTEGKVRYIAASNYTAPRLAAALAVSCLPYYALAKGFLTGKYRPDAHVDSARATAAGAYLDGHGLQLLAAP